MLVAAQIMMMIIRTPTFGPVVPDGYGFCYSLKRNLISAGISQFNTSKETNIQQLSSSLRSCLLALREAALTAQMKSKL